MNELLLELKRYPRAMQSYVFTLYEIALESKAKEILEIGVRQAQSTRAILSALEERKSGFLTSIDLGDRTRKIAQHPELIPYFRMITGDSHNKETFDKVNDRVYDILFLDGDHSYEGFRKDCEMYIPIIKKGGLVICHDISNSKVGVREYWKEIILPKVAFEWGKAAGGITPGLGIIQIPK